MIKGIERVTSMLNFKLRGVEGWLHGMRQDSPPRMTSIDYELIVDTEEPDQRLELLYTNVRKYGTTPILKSASHQVSEEQINTMMEILTHLPRLNEPAPDFEAKTAHGMRRLADYKERSTCFHGEN